VRWVVIWIGRVKHWPVFLKEYVCCLILIRLKRYCNDW
jgi:hypothetical protein